MAVDPQALFEASQFGKLEPMAGFALALNIAYLNLGRWRYKEQAKNIASQTLDKLDRKGSHEHLSQYNALMYLTGGKHKRSKLPFLIRAFHFIYGTGLDRGLSTIFTTVSFLILAIGVMHAIQMGGWLIPSTGYEDARNAFWVLIVSLAVPTLSVWAGRLFVDKLRKYALECGEEIAAIYEGKIGEIEVPPIPESYQPPYASRK